MKLTKTDRLILNSYASMVENLSSYLGSVYEISLHSLEDYNHSVIKIMNGYHSGRSAGAPLTDLALNMLKRIQDKGFSSTDSFTSYNAINPVGEHLKSSTIPVLGENNRVIGILCINPVSYTHLSFVRFKIWHSGIKSDVRFAPMIPAIRAQPSTSPFAMEPSFSSFKHSGLIKMLPFATASRFVSAFSPTSTMRAFPCSSKCVNSMSILPFQIRSWGRCIQGLSLIHI